MIVDVQTAIRLLEQGQTVGIPTETVYGLAARIDRPGGVAGIFSVKERPFFDPLIVHVADVTQSKTLVSEWGPIADALAHAFWPGPLTLVQPKHARVDAMITSGLETVGLRCPAHPLARALIEGAGPLAAPSANKFGRTSPTRAHDVEREFAGAVAVVDGGPCDVGVESTIVAIEGEQVRLLRPGSVLPSQIKSALAKAGAKFTWVEKDAAAKIAAPGNMIHHYMPSIPLVILKRVFAPDELEVRLRAAFARMPTELEGVKLTRPVGFGKRALIGLADDPRVAAREFYAKLREYADQRPDLLVLEWREEWDEEAWSPIVDRMKKAASFILD